jgi:hypothetical protein
MVPDIAPKNSIPLSAGLCPSYIESGHGRISTIFSESRRLLDYKPKGLCRIF